jgi:hypothetical protein
MLGSSFQQNTFWACFCVQKNAGHSESKAVQDPCFPGELSVVRTNMKTWSLVILCVSFQNRDETYVAGSLKWGFLEIIMPKMD